MSDPQTHIKQLQRRQEDTDPSLLRALAGAINRLEKSFPEQWHFLMEFLQNADDSQSSSFSLELTERRIRILNDGREFDYDDVESICNVGHSSKAHTEKGEDYIGYLGVGFKSVFLISDNPQINSGGYRFEFNKQHWDDPDQIPWQITPLWVNENPPDVPAPYTTAFEIPISDNITEETFDKLTNELSAKHISDTTILFLKNLNHIEIHNNTEGKHKVIEKEKVSNEENYDIVQISIESDNEKKVNRWLVFDDVVEVPEEVKDDPMTQRWERDDLETREVRVAFSLGEQDQLQEQAGTAHMGVFSFLPLKEVPSGLNFLVQGDFLTAPGRETIHRDAPWNRWLAREVYQLIERQVIPEFKKNDAWKYNFTQILYPREGGHSLFDEEIHQPLQELLKNSPVILTDKEDFSRPDECVNINPSVEDLISESDFSELYPQNSKIHPDLKTAPALKNEMQDGPSFSSSGGISRRMNDLLEIKADQKDTTFFSDLYRLFGKWADSTLAGTRIRRDPIVLTQTYELKQPREVSYTNDEVSLPNQLADDFDLLHSNIRDEELIDILEKLGVDRLSQDKIDSKLQSEKLLDLKNEWPKLNDNGKIEKTQECLKLYLEGEINATDLDALEVKSKSGKWIQPSEAIFSKEFEPEHRIEELYQEGLIPSEASFLSSIYLDEDYRLSDWRQFFEDLGVESNLNKSMFVEQVAIESALRFEEAEGRTAKALSRHEEVEGYDIESEGRVIEVKGSDSDSPTVRLTTKQFSRLKSDTDKYYLYIVRNALDTPRLVEIKGENVLDVGFSVRVDYSDMKDISENQYRVL